MSITANFSNGALSAFGDTLDNNVSVSRNAAGTLLVNGGAVPVTGGTPTLANTALVQTFGQGGNDVLTLDEANGALPAAHLFGRTGNDVLTGGSGNDQIFGQDDNDTLLGRGGFDLLFANEVEATALFQTNSFDEAVSGLRDRVKLAAVTRGERGSVILSDGERLSVAAEAVEKVVDTTGAGDQYAAGFMFGLSRGRPLQACGRLASLAAAEVISHYGPRPQVSLQDLAAAKGY